MITQSVIVGGLPKPLDDFNAQPAPAARQALLACCGSQTWADALLAQRPFPSPKVLLDQSSALWFNLPKPDWLQAFACHPRIGEAKPATTAFLAHSTTEQDATQRTLAECATRLLEGNRAYEAKFGFLYIVFASGRPAPELLAVLEQRLANTREEELEEAARQQDRITRLRIERWLTP